MKKICLVSVYFGTFPNNARYFFESVKHNTTINFLCFSDINPEELEYEIPDNFCIIHMDFEEFNKKLEDALQIQYNMEKVYKICDFRPFFGIIFRDELNGYDYWGFHDFDMIFGNLRNFLTDDLLNAYDRIFVNGHLSLFKNCERINSICMEGSSKQTLKDVISTKETIAYDEMSGMRLAFAERGLSQYINRNVWADIVESIPTVVNNNMFNRPGQFYMWEDGLLWWCIRKNGQAVKLRELIYVHFQKRKMQCDEIMQGMPFYIYGKNISHIIPSGDITTSMDIFCFYGSKIHRRIERILRKTR